MKVSEIVEAIIDYRGKTPPKTVYGVPLITAKVIKGGRIEPPNEFISEETYSQWMRRGIPRQWDLLITTEAPLGEVALLRTTDKIALAQRVILLRGRPELVDQRYLHYAFQSPIVQSHLKSRATGTTVLGIKQSELREVDVPVPPLDVQRKIASILAAYDELIENNLRRIEILKEMAQAIYNEWFIDLRFPGHAEVPPTETRQGLIPKDWRHGAFGDIANERREGVNPQDLHPTSRYVGLEHMPRRSIVLTQHGEASEVSSRKWKFSVGDILFGKLRPYFHKVVLAPYNGICSTDVIPIRPVEGFEELALFVASSEDFVGHASSAAAGTDRPRSNWKDLAKYPNCPTSPTPPKFIPRLRSPTDGTNDKSRTAEREPAQDQGPFNTQTHLG